MTLRRIRSSRGAKAALTFSSFGTWKSFAETFFLNLPECWAETYRSLSQNFAHMAFEVSSRVLGNWSLNMMILPEALWRRRRRLSRLSPTGLMLKSKPSSVGLKPRKLLLLSKLSISFHNLRVEKNLLQSLRKDLIKSFLLFLIVTEFLFFFLLISRNSSISFVTSCSKFVVWSSRELFLTCAVSLSIVRMKFEIFDIFNPCKV